MIATAHLLLLTVRAKKNGKFPVKIRVIYQRNYKDFPIGVDLNEIEFEGATSKNIKKEYRRVSIKLNSEIAKANKIIADTGIFTFKKFEDAYYGRLKDAKDIFPFFDEYITNLSNDGMIKTAIGYKTSKNSFKLFRKSFGFYDITPQFLKDYELFEKKRGLSNTIY